MVHFHSQRMNQLYIVFSIIISIQFPLRRFTHVLGNNSFEVCVGMFIELLLRHQLPVIFYQQTIRTLWALRQISVASIRSNSLTHFIGWMVEDSVSPPTLVVRWKRYPRFFALWKRYPWFFALWITLVTSIRVFSFRASISFSFLVCLQSHQAIPVQESIHQSHDM